MDLRRYFKTNETKDNMNEGDENTRKESNEVVSVDKEKTNASEKVGSINETEIKKQPCKYGSRCYQRSEQHLAKYTHPKRISEEQKEGSSKRYKIDRNTELSVAIEKSHSQDDSVNNAETVNSQSSGHNISDSDDDGPNSFSKSEKLIDPVEEIGGEPLLDINISGDIKLALKRLYIVEFPDDFYNFYDFCKSVYSKSPKTALRDIGLELVGPYDFLNGDIKSCTRTQIIRHYRYYYDTPEFFTVLKSTNSELHYGYYFDDPNKPSSLIVSNDPKIGCKINVISSNIFTAVNIHINDYIKTCSPFDKVKVQKIQKNLLTKWTKETKVNIESNSLSIRERNSKVNSKTFHGAGIVVPLDKNTDVGYRPLAENDKTLKDLFKKIAESETEGERKVRWNKIEHVITFASIAADECDFGTPLELGIDMFCQGHECFHRTAEQLMTMAYELLGRNYYADIIKIHLNNRVQGSNLNFAARK